MVALAALAGGVAFGFFGGEYSTPDWWTMQRAVAQEEAALERLKQELDSLRAYADSLETDSATQERVAREKFGMLRDGELLYRVEPVER